MLIVRIVASVLVATAAVALAAVLVPGLEVGEPLRFAAWLALLNGIAVPLVVRLAYPLVVYTVGLASLALNAGAVLAAAEIVPDVEVAGPGAALVAALVITAATLALNALLAIDDEGSWSRHVATRAARQRGMHPTVETARARGHEPPPGVVFLEVDGCSEGVLRRALRNGWMPNLHELVRSGSHVVRGWRTGVSSQTGASQAGLLLGDDEGIVAFRWYERRSGRVVVSSSPRDAREIEDRLDSGAGLLAGGGVSRNNLFAGDAEDAALTLSRVLRPGGAGPAYRAYFARPWNAARTFVLALQDIASELAGGLRARRRGVWPRLQHKGWKYPFVRLSTTVVMREVTSELLLGDMVRGVPSAYATFVGYDEVAHHDGVEREPALEQLRQLDRTFGRLIRAAEHAPRRYEFVVLSDHGQTHGATFLQRHGTTLEQLVHDHLRPGASTEAWVVPEEPDAQLAAARASAAPATGSPDADVVVLASGNLGLVYLVGREERCTLGELEQLHPGLARAVAAHPGVGFVLVRTSERGPVVLGAGGRRWLDDGRVEGEDPLAPFGPTAAARLARHDRMRDMPDLLVMSACDPGSGEVAAFEELIGSHGGLGGEQEEPFLLYPAGWSEPEGELDGAVAVHRQLVRWLEQAGTRPRGLVPPRAGHLSEPAPG